MTLLTFCWRIARLDGQLWQAEIKLGNNKFIDLRGIEFSEEKFVAKPVILVGIKSKSRNSFPFVRVHVTEVE